MAGLQAVGFAAHRKLGEFKRQHGLSREPAGRLHFHHAAFNIGAGGYGRLFANVAFTYDAGPYQTLTPVSYYDTGNAALNYVTNMGFSLYNLATLPVNAAFAAAKGFLDAWSRFDEAVGDRLGPTWEAIKNTPFMMPVEWASAMTSLSTVLDMAAPWGARSAR